MRTLSKITSWVTLGILLAAVAAGCGGGAGAVSSANVSGTVTLNGAPLANARVLFQPDAKGNPGPPSSGETDAAGTFTLTFPDGKEGAVVGKHNVIVTTRKMAPSEANSDVEVEVAPEQVPDAYRATPPTFEVPKAGTEEAEIKLVGPPPSGQPVGGERRDPRND
jgi:hypothetical protein